MCFHHLKLSLKRVATYSMLSNASNFLTRKNGEESVNGFKKKLLKKVEDYLLKFLFLLI